MPHTPPPDVSLPDHAVPGLPDDGLVVVLSGAGLSAASGVPTFRGAGGWWRGHAATDLATPEAFAANPDLVLTFYETRREALREIQPNDGHRALVQLQAALGPERVVLVTQNVDGLLQVAAQEAGLPIDLMEMHGGLWTVRCARNEDHPHLPVERSALDARGECAVCGAAMRPDIVWFGEMPFHMPRIEAALGRCSLFLSVGTSGVVYPAAGFTAFARSVGAQCIEVNPEPSGGDFHTVIAEGAEVALPRLVEGWLG
jgi:NAD-dependent deacetylase